MDHDATEELAAVAVTSDILDPVAAAPQGALQALVARLTGVVTHFDQRVIVEIVPVFQVRVHNMDRVYGADITGSVEPQLLPGSPPAGQHSTVVRREVHL